MMWYSHTNMRSCGQSVNHTKVAPGSPADAAANQTLRSCSFSFLVACMARCTFAFNVKAMCRFSNVSGMGGATARALKRTLTVVLAILIWFRPSEDTLLGDHRMGELAT